MGVRDETQYRVPEVVYGMLYTSGKYKSDLILKYGYMS